MSEKDPMKFLADYKKVKDVRNDAIIEAVKEGNSFQSIADKSGLCTVVLRKIVKDAGIDISNFGKKEFKLSAIKTLMKDDIGVKEIAEKTGLSVAYVVQLCRQNDLKPMGGFPRRHAIDKRNNILRVVSRLQSNPTLKDAKIADDLNISRERVRQIRESAILAGIDLCSSKERRSMQHKRIEDAIRDGTPTKVIAKDLDVAHTTVERIGRNIGEIPRLAGSYTGPESLQKKLEALALLQNDVDMTQTEIGERFQWAPAIVSMLREKAILAGIKIPRRKGEKHVQSKEEEVALV